MGHKRAEERVKRHGQSTKRQKCSTKEGGGCISHLHSGQAIVETVEAEVFEGVGDGGG
jgi:hypothetical protein